eukprot:CAMPEP_0114262046 /NCGR_PEP_ID=MMETSP0058-20121206/21532_1 /TAXON_ID=36894 /ORGANISM="Pyramimonas parkeae, CCMP726" /LENGTH=247 /DNA_ID=CAMNT_0001377763 /DNA_START=1627 /DNA_END=2371 /DNA_ORIENTATION=-
MTNFDYLIGACACRFVGGNVQEQWRASVPNSSMQRGHVETDTAWAYILDENGNLPKIDDKYCVWQFNFRGFDLKEDLYAQDSIELLKQSGIDFHVLEERGVDIVYFGELLMSSGIVLNDEVHWITFHSGYDFGYLLKVLTCSALPATENEFFEILKLYFPCIYDMKYLMKFCGSLHGGLNKLAEQLDVERVGPQHQAGSDSLLTSTTFFELCHSYFGENSDLGLVQKYVGILYGLGVDGDGEAHRPP